MLHLLVLLYTTMQTSLKEQGYCKELPVLLLLAIRLLATQGFVDWNLPGILSCGKEQAKA